MKITVLDTKTGETASYPGLSGLSNWECDCNRSIKFDDDHEDTGFCRGAERYLVTAFEMEEGEDWTYSMREMNQNYPPELLAKYSLPPP